MKSQEFGDILRAFACMLNAAGAGQARDQITTFAAIFDATPTCTVSTLMKRLSQLPASGRTGNPNLGDVAGLLVALKGFLSKTSKVSVLTDISAVEPVLLDRRSTELGAFVHMATEAPPRVKRTARKPEAVPVRNDLVGHYQQAVRTSLGNDEQFQSVYKELASNVDMGKGELIALAKEVVGISARSRAEALKKILSMHQSMLTFKAKSRATGGRSAA